MSTKPPLFFPRNRFNNNNSFHLCLLFPFLTRSENMGFISLSLVALAVILSIMLWKIFKALIWKPYRLTKYFAKQGIKGPGYNLLKGSLTEMKNLRDLAAATVMDPNDHNIIPRTLPHYHKWSSIYGATFLYWCGKDPRILVTDPDHIKEILATKFGFYSKPKSSPETLDILGEGLALINGLTWARHRRIINPAFTIDKVKAMTKTMATCILSTLDSWKEQIVKSDGQCKEIDVSLDFQDLTADIIAHTAFGISYTEGKKVFRAQRELTTNALAYFGATYIPGTHYLPTELNRHMWKLSKEVRSNLVDIIKSRLRKGFKVGSFGDDILGFMLDASENGRTYVGPKLTMDEIVEECKTLFFSGHETTSNVLTWTMFLLSLEQNWQEKVREEVLRECGTDIPDADQLSKLKLLKMVILEALRLYGPVLLVLRATLGNIKLGDWTIPKGTQISIPVAMLHHDKKYWGEDANKFNPMRFADGLSNAATHPDALLAFSMGPRACVGQKFAMMEAKLVLAMILQRFSFSLSPNYKHAPINSLTLQPQFGLPILLKTLRS